MYTLYDLLGASPDDDAESLKLAFRKAVKTSHPDIHPGDPDAAHRFRQIVRAHSVLGDTDSRAAYDRMLDVDRRLRAAPKRGIVASTISKIVSDAIAVGVLALLMLAGFILFKHSFHGPVAAEARSVAPAPVEAAAPLEPHGSGSLDNRSDRSDAASLAKDTIDPNMTAAVPVVGSGGGPSPAGPSVNGAPRDGRFYRDRGFAAYRRGDLMGALADFDIAIRFAPDDRDAHIDRSIVFYRMGETDRAFADLAEANRIARSPRIKHTEPASRARLLASSRR